MSLKPIKNTVDFKGRAARLALSGALVLTMAAGLVSLPLDRAYAADGTVTIVSANPVANADATYDAYVFFTAAIDDQNKATGITWALSDADQGKLVTFLGANYTTWLTENKHTETGAATKPANVLEFISMNINASAGIKTPSWVNGDTFASNLAEWAIANLTAVGTATGGTAFTAPEGYYLFVTNAGSLGTGEMGTAPIWFPLGGSATTITEKAATPTIVKEVQEDSTQAWGALADAEVGQDVNYRITLTMPTNLNTFDTFYGQVSDNLPTGMTLSTDDVQIMLGEDDITNSFTITFSNQKLVASCDNLKAIEGLVAGSGIVVNYKAHFTLTPAPVYGGAGNKNTATFEYSNDPNTDTHGTSNAVEAKAYTYMIKVDKLDIGDKTLHLAGAQFTIRNADDNYLKADGTWTADKTQAGKFTTDENGVATFAGLDEGDYVLNEVVAPAGYKRYNGDITITITSEFDADQALVLGATVTGGLTGTVIKGADATAGTINIDVTDEGVSLALTGAQGVGLGGAAIVAAGAIWYVVRRRKNADTDEN